MSVNLYNATTDTLKNIAGDIINPKSVNEMIAPIEDGTASKAYAVGEQFIMNDLLCEATQAIAQGDTMVIGTNCKESEQLSKQVKDINTSLTANGNRFEAGYSSANNEYGFNIDSTFYPIGASSDGDGGSQVQLDWGHPLFTFTSSNLTYTAIQDCYLCGVVYGNGSPNVDTTVSINSNIINIGSVVPSNSNDHAYIPPIRIAKGDIVALNQCVSNTHLYLFPFNTISSEVIVYNEAKLTLDYTNPIFNFGSGTSFTATETCWLVGSVANGRSMKINNVIYSDTPTGGTTQILLRLEIGDVVTLTTTSTALNVVRGTISGSVGHLGGALYPDYSRLIANPTGHSYTATKDCFLCGVGFVSGGDIGIFINGHCAFRQGDNIEILLHTGDVVTAGAPSTSYTFKQDGAYYTNSLGVFEIAD